MRYRSTTALHLVALAAIAPLAPLALVPGCASQSHDTKAAHAPAHDRFDLSWLEGAWTASAWDGTLNADYTTRADGFTIGYTHLIKDGVQAYHEFEIFAHDATGFYLIPHPAGKPAPRFALTSHTPGRAVYENREKDFPTRIVYERIGDSRIGDQLIITLSDPLNKTSEPLVFTFTRRTN